MSRRSSAAAEPVADDDIGARFARAMAAAGCVEPAPHLAVALSGGPDSLGLTLLARDWAAARGGRVQALVVDHGLRAGSAGDARRAAALAAAAGVPARILTLAPGAIGMTGIEAGARAARYAALTDACRAAGILHLLTGHSLDDQAETVLIRLGRGSGVDGLAAMPPVRPEGGIRLIRPVLGIRRASLAAVVAAAGLTPLHDPMNDDDRVQRVRLRAAATAAALEGAGLDPARVARSAARAAAARAALDAQMLRVAFRGGLRLHVWGGAELPLALFADPDLSAPGLEDDLPERLVGRLAMVVGGQDLPPRGAAAARLAADLVAMARSRAGGDHLPQSGRGQGGRTLGGCRFLWGGRRLLVLREPRAIAAPRAVTPGEALHWDGRFMVIVPDTPACRAAADDGRLRLRAMGEDLARRLGEVAPAAAASLRARVAPRAIASLPVLTRLDVPLAFPHLTESIRREAAEDETLARSTFRAWFAPSRPLDGDGVFWAMAGEHSAGKRPRS